MLKFLHYCSMKPKIFISIAIAIILCFVGYLVYRNYYHETLPDRSQNEISRTDLGKKDLGENKNPAPEPAEKSETDSGFSAQGGPALGWKLYKNPDFMFEIQYPETWTVSEENIENVRGEQTKAFYFSPMGGSASGGKKPGSDLRFVILPRDGLSYGLSSNGTTTDTVIGGSFGDQTQYVLSDGRYLWIVHPKYGGFNWAPDIGRIDAMTSVEDPAGDIQIFEKMLNSFKLKK